MHLAVLHVVDLYPEQLLFLHKAGNEAVPEAPDHDEYQHNA